MDISETPNTPIQTPIGEAKTNLSKLIRQVEAGAEIILARGKTPVAKIVPLAQSKPRKPFPFGMYAHLVDLDNPTDFLEPMSEEELALWENSKIFPNDPNSI